MLGIVLNRFDSFVEIRVCGLTEGGSGIKKTSFDRIETDDDLLALGRLIVKLVEMTTCKNLRKIPSFKKEESGKIIRLEYHEKLKEPELNIKLELNTMKGD